MSDFLENNNTAVVDSGNDSFDMSKMPSEEEILDRVFSFVGNDDKQQEANNVNAQQSQPANNQASEPAQANNAQAQNVAEKPFSEMFRESTEKAFLNESGGLNVDKINSFFVNGKSAFSYIPEVKQDIPPAQTKSETVERSPEEIEKEYRDGVQSLGLGWASRIRELSGQYGIERALDIVENEYNRMISDDFLKRDLENQKKAFSKEIEEARKPLEEAKKEAALKQRDAVIQANVNKVAQNFEGVFPGVPGEDIVDEILTNKDYAADVTRMFLFKNHPELTTEKDAEKRTKIAEDYLKELKHDPAMLGHLVEYGRLKMAMQQLPAIIKHAQEVALSNKQNTREVSGLKSNIASAGASVGKKGEFNLFGETFKIDEI